MISRPRSPRVQQLPPCFILEEAGGHIVKTLEQHSEEAQVDRN